jgi:large subunit ribosomal protein L4
MAEAKLYAFDGDGEPQTIELDERLFGAPVNADLLYRTVRMQLENRRQGTSCTKTRGEVRGGGRKPWRQKGTGRARAGSRRSPVWPGGGIVFGPRPREYRSRLPKKMRQGALVAALSDRAADGQVVLVDRMGFQEPKTKAAVALLDRVGMASTTLVAVATGEYNRAVKKSFSNLPGVRCLAAGGLNVYDILRHQGLLLSLPAVEELKERF